MIKPIERPIWAKLIEFQTHQNGETSYRPQRLDYWFDQNVKPLNEAIRNGAKAYGARYSTDPKEWIWDTTSNPLGGKTHTALLIGIEPIKQETALDVLKEYIEGTERFLGWKDHDEYRAWKKRAKAVIARERANGVFEENDIERES